MERTDVPVGSYELDTASLPDDLDEYCFSNNFTKTPDFSSALGGNEATIYNHDFDLDKKKRKFQKGQIWALGRSENGSIRCYARIKKIESPPIRLHVDLLELVTTTSNAIRPNVCGLYKAYKGGRQIVSSDFFLYLVKAEVIGKKRFNIYPSEEEIWVLRNKRDSKCMVSDLDNCEGEIVEVVGKNGDMIKVLCLSRVPGYKSVFRAPVKENSKSRILEIPCSEFNRFCYRVPATLLTNEHDGLLRGSWDLNLHTSQV